MHESLQVQCSSYYCYCTRRGMHFIHKPSTSQLHKGKAPHPQANPSTASQLHKGNAPNPQANPSTTSQLHKGNAPHPQANPSTASQLHKGNAPNPEANPSTTSQLHKGNAPHPANASTTSQLQGPFLQVNRINYLPVLQSYLQTCLQSHQTFLQIQIHRQLRDHCPLCPHHHHQSDCRNQNHRTDRSHHRRIH